MSDEPKIGPRDAALVFRADTEEMELLLPDYADNDLVPEGVVCLSACLVRLTDDDGFVDDLIDWLEEQGLRTVQSGTA